MTTQLESAGRALWSCSQCGADNESTFKFCGECGAAHIMVQPEEQRANEVPVLPAPEAGDRPLKRKKTNPVVVWLLVIIVCIRVVALIIRLSPVTRQQNPPAQSSRNTDDELSYGDFEMFVERHNIRAILVNKETGDVVGYYRIPANRTFHAKMPSGDFYLYDTLRKDGCEVTFR